MGTAVLGNRAGELCLVPGSTPEFIHPDANEAEIAHLQEIARLRLRTQSPHQTVEAAGLLDELIIHLYSGAHQPVTSRAHLQAEAAIALRRVLVEYAKAPDPDKTPASCRVRLGGAKMAQPCQLRQIAELNDQLEKLAGQDARMAAVVELRYFGGMSNGEVAEALGIAEGTVKRDWRLARAWLYAQLHGDRLHRRGPEC